ncbi:amino acid adenylation domain-containing protein, partial [Fulvivirga sp. 29W222]
DFMGIYEGKLLPELSIQYKDYAVWKNSQADILDQQKNYWTERFSRDVPVLNLPGDLALNHDNLTHGDLFHFDLSPEESQKIHLFINQQKGITLFSFLLASFQVLLSRLSNQEDIIVGSPVVNRSHADTEHIIGLFLNTLPFRNFPEHQKPFIQFLKEVQRESLEAFEHQEYQFEDLISELNLKRDLTRNPLFDVFFNLLNFENDLSFELDELKVQTITSELKPNAKFHLTLYAKESDDQILFTCLYKSGFFKRDTIKYIFEEFKKLIQQILNNADTAIGAYNIFSQNEIQLKTDRCSPQKPFTPIGTDQIHQSIVDRFKTIVHSFPQRTAIIDQNQKITYQELDVASNRIANTISQLNKSDHDGFAPRAALLFGHNIHMLEGLWGALKAAHAYVPMVADQPVERMADIMRDAQARVLLTQNEYMPLAKQIVESIEHPISIINIESIDKGIIADLKTDSINPNELAYILYTSGSTGKPKGVMQTHRNALYFWKVYTNALHIDHHDTLTMLSNYGHDAAVMSFFGTLLNGATGILYDIKNRGLDELNSVIDKHQITIYHSTPSVFRAFTSTLKEKASKSIRLVVMGGEATLPSDVESFKSLFSDECLMINGLGPTESTITIQNFISKDSVIGNNVPVGHPVDATDVFILDQNHKATDVFQEGMLVYESDFITPGYWNDPDKTNQAIVTGIFEQGKRYYLSGDLGRRLPDGNIEFLGRSDNQVKVRGFRIELGEIESQLAYHPQVQAAVVVAHQKNQDKQLVAYFVAQDHIDSHVLKNYLLQKLPDYMIPTLFIKMEELPLNRNGKVDRKALPKPEVDIQEFIAPQNEVEEQLVDIWSEVLQIPKEKISTNSNFFELGGHSLKAMNIIDKVHLEIGVKLPVRDFFKRQTVYELAELIAAVKLVHNPNIDGSNQIEITI